MQSFVDKARIYWTTRQESNALEKTALGAIKSNCNCLQDEIAMRDKCAACIEERLDRL